MMNRIFDPEDPIDLSFEPASPEREGSEASTMASTTVPSPAVALAAAAAALASAAPTAAPTAADTTAADATAATGMPATAAATMPATTAAAAAVVAAVAAASATDGATEVTAAAVTPGRLRNRPGRAPRRERAPLSSASEADAARTKPGLDDRLVLGSALAGVCLLSVAGSLMYFGYWNRLQQNLAQERNLLLVERLRSLGPANPTPAPAAPLAAPGLPAAPAAAAAPGGEGLPPPPPEEPWMQQLSTLPSPAATPPRVLTVPVSPRLGAAAPAATAPATAPAATAAAAAGTPASRPQASRPPAGTLPLQLVGVVGGAGRSSSAIFLVGGSSMSVNSGEMIGSSGWRLRSAEGETALIERDGDVRQVSIASGNGF